jgi:hypothetical protein
METCGRTGGDGNICTPARIAYTWGGPAPQPHSEVKKSNLWILYSPNLGQPSNIFYNCAARPLGQSLSHFLSVQFIALPHVIPSRSSTAAAEGVIIIFPRRLRTDLGRTRSIALPIERCRLCTQC